MAHLSSTRRGSSSPPGGRGVLALEARRQVRGVRVGVVVGLYLLLLVDAGSDSPPNVISEVCQWDTYEPTCAEDEVVVMERAQYGRMRIGQCVTENLGFLGCNADVLDIADRKCSGRRSCKIEVPDADFEKTKPCSERQNYLEAQYKCVKVEGTERRQCNTCDFVKLTAPSGFIASSTTEDTGCGSADCPWLVEAQPGQQIRVRLYDFGFPTGSALEDASAPSSPNVCRVYAVLKEETTRRSVTLCGGQAREKDAYTTTSNTLEVRILGKSTNAERMYFMLHYSVLGCADLAPPSGGWFKRHGDTALVGCNSGSDDWRLTCNGTHWVGVYGTCPSDTQSAASIAANNFSFEISIAIVIVIAVFVGSLILVVGLVCFRRHNSGRPDRRGGRGAGGRGGRGVPPEALYHERGLHVPQYTEHDDGGDLHPHHPHNTLKGAHSKTYSDVRNEYAHIWEMPLPQPQPPTQGGMKGGMDREGGMRGGGRGDIEVNMNLPPMPAPLPMPPEI